MATQQSAKKLNLTSSPYLIISTKALAEGACILSKMGYY